VPEEAGLRLVQTPSAKPYQKLPSLCPQKMCRCLKAPGRYNRGRLPKNTLAENGGKWDNLRVMPTYGVFELQTPQAKLFRDLK